MDLCWQSSLCFLIHCHHPAPTKEQASFNFVLISKSRSFVKCFILSVYTLNLKKKIRFLCHLASLPVLLHRNNCLYMLCVCKVSCVRLFVTLGTVFWQDPLSMKFSRQEYWSGLPFPIPGNPLDPGIEPMIPVSPALHVLF